MTHARTISLPAAISLVIANMVGTGVFTSLGFQLPALQSAFPILLLWVVGGIISLCGALCYAELVAMLPRSGGEYHLLREAYHPLAGFLAGWISLMAGFAAPIAITGMAFGKYAGGLGLPFDPRHMAAALILVIAAVHLGSVRLVGGFLSVFASVKVLLIISFVLGAMFLAQGSAHSLAPKPGDWGHVASPGFAVSLVYVMYAYTGWNGAAYVTDEVRDPQRTVPLALGLGTLIVMVLYVALNAVFLWLAPWELMTLKVEAALIAAKSIFGEQGGRFMGGMIAVGLVSTLTAMTWAGSRVNQRLGQDLQRLGWMARKNRWGAPFIAVAVQTCLALVMLYSGTFDQVLNYIESLLLVSSLLAVAAVIWLRIRRPDAERPYRTPFYPVTPLLFIGTTVYMLYYMVRERPAETGWGLLTLIVGAAVYAALHYGQDRTESRSA